MGTILRLLAGLFIGAAVAYFTPQLPPLLPLWGKAGDLPTWVLWGAASGSLVAALLPAATPASARWRHAWQIAAAALIGFVLLAQWQQALGGSASAWLLAALLAALLLIAWLPQWLALLLAAVLIALAALHWWYSAQHPKPPPFRERSSECPADMPDAECRALRGL